MALGHGRRYWQGLCFVRTWLGALCALDSWACPLPEVCHRASILWSYLWPAGVGLWVAPPFRALSAPPSAHTGGNSGAGSSSGRPLPPSPEVSGSPDRKEGGKGKQIEDKSLVVWREQEAGRLGVGGALLTVAWWRNVPQDNSLGHV